MFKALRMVVTTLLIAHATPALAARVFSAEKLASIQTVLVIPAEWKPEFTAFYQGATAFGNARVALSQDFATTGCIVRGAGEVQPDAGRMKIEVLAPDAVQALQRRIEKPASGPRTYARQLIQQVRPEHPADLYVLALTVPIGHEMTSWGSHGFMGFKTLFSGQPDLRAFWHAEFRTWDAASRELMPHAISSSGARFSKVKDNDAFVHIVNTQSTALRALLRALIVRETHDLLDEMLRGQKQHRNRVLEDLAPLEKC